MDFKKIFVCILLLVIFTIGTISASEDVQSIDDLGGNSSDGDIIADGEDAEENLDYVSIEDEYDISHENSSFSNVSDEEGLNGTITVEFDNNTVYNQTFNGTDKNISFNASTISGFKLGKVNVTVTYNKNNLAKPIISTKIVDFTYPFSFVRLDESDIYYGDKIKFNIALPRDVKNKVIIKINEKTYEYVLRNGKATLYIPTADLTVQEHVAYALYEDPKYPLNIVNTTFKIYPKIDYPNEISIGEKEDINVKADKSNAIVTIYNYDSENGIGSVITSVSMNNGVVSIPLDKLTQGNHELYLEYVLGDYEYNKTIEVNVFPNTHGIEASISASEIFDGNIIAVYFSGPKSDERVYIYVDGKEYKSDILSSGEISENIIGLTQGDHKIKVSFKDGDKFYSNTFLVNVKPAPIIKKVDIISLKLTKVKVKKSAKKLVLKATLKINKKAKKGLKVTFKFNGKKYRAKTNAKGIAKVTIKKKVLKKLKVGKKIKYQVSFGKKIAKRTAKVGK